MRVMRRVSTTMALGFMLFMVGCSGSPTSPKASPPQTTRDLLGGALELLGDSHPVSVLHRRTPLAEDETTSQVIGPAGGVLQLPKAGLTVFVPPLAVSTPTRITITAPAGDLVGYECEPQGLHFAHDLTAVQDMWDTDANLLWWLGSNGLEAAYFKGELEPTVNALEILPFNLMGALGTGEFHIAHFSGYVIATD